MPERRKRGSFPARILGREVMVRYRRGENSRVSLLTVFDIGIHRALPLSSEFGHEAREMLKERFPKKKE